jgi:hypothetical protein
MLSRSLGLLAGLCLLLGAPGCAKDDDGDGGASSSGYPGDGGDDGDGGGDDGGAAPTCDEPAEGTHDGTIKFEGNAPDTSVIEGIGTVTGAVFVDGTDLSNLDFLACVHTIGNGLNIFDNDNLTSINGLVSLTSLSGDLTIAENDGLTTLGGPSGITSVDNLSVNQNSSLENISGLGGLETINQTLTIRYNDSLTSVSGLSSLTRVVTRFNVVHNPQLPCGNIASLGDQLDPPPEEAIWCDGNKDCENHPACGG